MPGQFSLRQSLALIDELESATKLVELGVAELHGLSLSHDFHHLPLQLLSQGLERFLKLTFAMAELGGSGALPSLQRVKRYGHDLARLTDDVVALAELRAQYARRRVVQEDLGFIRSDADFRRLLTQLAEFGEGGRYHRLDELLDPDGVDPDSDPRRAWEDLESHFIRRLPDGLERIASVERSEEVHREAIISIATLVERFARAISRMWTLGALPEEALTYSNSVGKFLYLGDEQLGQSR